MATSSRQSIEICRPPSMPEAMCPSRCFLVRVLDGDRERRAAVPTSVSDERVERRLRVRVRDALVRPPS